MKNLEFLVRITKRIPCEKQENHERLRISYLNYKNHEYHTVSTENHENYENLEI